MNPLSIAQVIVGHLKQQDALSLINSNIFIQRVPPNTTLPYLRVIVDKMASQTYDQHPADTHAVMKLTLVCNLSDGSEQLIAIHNAITTQLNKKQLVFQNQTNQRLIQCWHEHTHQPDVEHDRIELTSDWQIRSI
ncbi:MAG TPA: hypothetical protein DCM28_11005 [Phycisphaerales bacterium]|nr:hypothetical protein [Phycisphaerales bacterium]HCD32343.1 hypothetical protein [Phycisphaerales bacterium]|tara:strand:+ start:664 stop:1068 length:405 start_codon:yes stop_codon:yes gene_type:complete